MGVDASAERPLSCDVAILGAGPIGLMLANLLGTNGVDVIVIERNNGLVGLPRAIAYDAETLRLFAQVGLFDAIATGLIQDPEIVYFNARGRRLMDMNPPRSPFGHSPIGTFYQPHFEGVLLNGLERFASAQALFAHTVTALAQDRDGVDVRIETPHGPRALRAKFVVGCDGGASTTREAIGARLVGATYAERWLVIDALIDNHDIDKITFFCDPRRPAVRLPAVGSRVRFEFMQLPGENPDELASDSRIKEFIEPHIDFSRVKIERRVVYTFHARVADAWRKGRVLLAGDAAHLMPPFAGQGMNGGMKDAANIAWKLAAVLRGLASDAILDSYEPERAPVIRKMVDLSRRLGAVIMPTSRGIAAARDAIFACLNMSRTFREFVGRGGVVPPPAIGRSLLTGSGRDGLIGQMLPQPTVKMAEGSFPLDRFQVCHQWMALGIGLDPATMLSARDLAILDALDARFVCLNGRSESARTLELRCDDAVFDAWAKRHAVRAVLVRPDRFIADRLDAGGHDLVVLTPFASARGVAAPPIAA